MEEKNSHLVDAQCYYFCYPESYKGNSMRVVLVSMQNTLLSEAVARSLAETGEFRVEQVLPGKTGDIFSLCRAAQADILLMEVSRLPAYTL